MAGSYRLTLRDGPRVERRRFGSLDEALERLETSVEALSKRLQSEPRGVQLRRFEPVGQVAARAELAGPGRLLPPALGGIDVRGDGSVEAYVGGVKRRAIERRRGESATAALRRALRSGGGR